MKTWNAFFIFTLIYLSSCSTIFQSTFAQSVSTKDSPNNNLIVSVALMEGLADYNGSGPVIDLLKAIANQSNDNHWSIKVYPFKRSIRNVTNGSADAHYPFLENPLLDNKHLPFRYSQSAMGSVAFVIYTNVNNIVTKQQLRQATYQLSETDITRLPFSERNQLMNIADKEFTSWPLFKEAIKSRLSLDTYTKHIHAISLRAFPFIIETDRAHTDFFNFPTTAISTAEQGLKRLGLNRTDVYIFAATVADPVIIANKLSYIHRELYNPFQIKFLLNKNKNGLIVDKILTKALTDMRENKEILDILKRSIPVPVYSDWQPKDLK